MGILCCSIRCVEFKSKPCGGVRTVRRGRRVSPSAVVDPSNEGAGFTIAISMVFGGLAVVQGLKPAEPKPCHSCMTKGGAPCIFCDSTGTRETPVVVTKKELRKDAVLGLTRRSPYECLACKGSGMIMCKRCKGKGFV